MIEIVETQDSDLLADLNEPLQAWHYAMYPAIFKPYERASVQSFFKDTLKKDNVKALIAGSDGVAFGYALYASSIGRTIRFNMPEGTS